MEHKRKADDDDELAYSNNNNQMIISSEDQMMSMPNSSLLDISSCCCDDDDHRKMMSSDHSLGFLDFISDQVQDFNNFPFDNYSTNFDDDFLMLQNTDHHPPSLDQSRPPLPECSEVVTPNSSSISSSSTDQKKTQSVEDGDDDEDNQQKTNNKLSLKPKKKKQKKEREGRFAFMTKSDVDHLDDGYRWRKYGQKAVKNSPFPRSYYRCTSTACGVKKRVERSCEDTSIVVTTYEGTHTHPCPILPRGSFGIIPETTAFRGGGGGSGGGSSAHFILPPNPHQMLQYHHDNKTQQQQQPYFHHNLSLMSSLSTSVANNNTFSPPLIQERRFSPSVSSTTRDHGLLQDMLLPSKILMKQAIKEE